jgi:hypothetical protein
MDIYMSPPNGRAMKWIAVVAGGRGISFRRGRKEGKECLESRLAILISHAKRFVS